MQIYLQPTPDWVLDQVNTRLVQPRAWVLSANLCIDSSASSIAMATYSQLNWADWKEKTRR
jgi:hypothetical protein